MLKTSRRERKGALREVEDVVAVLLDDEQGEGSSVSSVSDRAAAFGWPASFGHVLYDGTGAWA
jgi:hypothetical protein